MASRLAGMKGGGFLNNVDGVFSDYEYTNRFPGETEDSDDLFLVVTVTPDGGEAVQTTLRAGSGQFLTVQDRHTVVNGECNAARIWDKADAYRFLSSIEEAGVDPIDDTDVSILSHTTLLGRRMRFEQEKDVERMAARAKAGKNPKRVDEKTGKEYDHTRLIVRTVYDSAPVKAAGSGPKGAPKTVAGKAAPKAVIARPGRSAVGSTTGAASAARPSDQSGSVDSEATAYLKAVLTDEGGTVLRSDLTRLVTTKLLADRNPNREKIRKRVYEEAFLSSVDGIEFGAVGQQISIPIEG